MQHVLNRCLIILMCSSLFSEAFASKNNGIFLFHQDVNQLIMPLSGYDTMITNQILFNGKVWIGLYYGVYGTEFLIDTEWKSGDIKINGRTFTGMEIKYDTYNDDLLVNYFDKRVLILNSEMVNSFSIYAGDDVKEFLNMTGINGMNGYYELLYDGTTKLYIKYNKRRAQFAVEARYDEFQPNNQLWLVKNQELIKLTNRRMLMKLLAGKDGKLKRELRNRDIKPDFKSPASIISLLEVFDMNQPE